MKKIWVAIILILGLQIANTILMVNLSERSIERFVTEDKLTKMYVKLLDVTKNK